MVSSIRWERDGAVDLGAAPLSVGWGAAEVGLDGERTRSAGVLVGGQERSKGTDVLITDGSVSPTHGPPAHANI